MQAPDAAGTATQGTKRLAAHREDFPLNAAVAYGAGERKKLERLCFSVARPPLAYPRLGRDGGGLVVHRPKSASRDGTTEFCCPWMDECHGRQDAGSGITDPQV